MAQCLTLIEDDDVVVVEPVVGDPGTSGKEAMLSGRDQVGDMGGAGREGDWWGLRRSYERRGVGLGVLLGRRRVVTTSGSGLGARLEARERAGVRDRGGLMTGVGLRGRIGVRSRGVRARLRER
jgi:hypothetical protein